jgi:hypothetical protein
METLSLTKPLQLFRSALSFDSADAANIQDLIHQQYVATLFKKYDVLKAYYLKHNPELYEDLILAEQKLEGNELAALLQIPEMSYLILKFLLIDKKIVVESLITAIDAFGSKRHNSFNIEKYKSLWMPDGSFFIKYNGQNSRFTNFDSYKLLDTIPVDFFSPYCLKITNQDVNEPAGHLIAPYDFGYIEEICELFEDTTLPVLPFTGITNQLTTYLKAIVINQITNDGVVTNLVSGSDARFIGRTVISNVQSAEPEKLIEAFIHESIHSTLYMGDIVDTWLPTREETHNAGYAAVSPWTGNKISISSIQEAIFVWYGIYKLWKISFDNQLYDRAKVEQRLIFVCNGFEKLNIRKIAAEHKFNLKDDFEDAVQKMKKEVLTEMFS